MAGVALVAAADAVLCLNGSFGHRRGTAPDPKRKLVGSESRRSTFELTGLRGFSRRPVE
jgi:hypothetical protein